MVSEDFKIRSKFRDAIAYVLQPPVRSNFLIINRTSDYLANLAEDAAKDLELKTTVFSLDVNHEGPYLEGFPEKLKKEIASKKYPRAVGFFTYPEGTDWGQKETPARVELIHGTIKKTPIGYMHAPGIEPDMVLNGAGRVDFQEMARNAEKMLNLLDDVRSIKVTAPAGTDIEVGIPSELIWETDCKIVPPDPYGDPGAMGNFIPGEVCIERRKKVSVAGREVEYPIKLIGNGTIVCDVCADNIDKFVDPTKPIRISVKDGVVKYFSSEDETFQTLHEEWKQREKEYGLPTILEEFGVGINDKARKSKNLLETEKMGGTIHIAAAHVNSHADFIVSKPTVTVTYENLSKRTIMKDGTLMLD